MAIPGDHNGWSTTPSMTLVANNTWVATQTFASANGTFKFAANNGWDNNWGGNAVLARVPAQALAPDANGANLSYAGFSNGPYRITFNDSTGEFRMEWAGSPPLPVPTITNLALVGTFNSWAPTENSRMTHHVDNPNVWSLAIELFEDISFQFFPNNSWDNQFGAPEPLAMSVPGVNIPVTISACGRTDFTLQNLIPGIFEFRLDVSNATFTVTQTVTNNAGSLSTITAVGNFVAGNPPDINLEKVGPSRWQSDFNVTNLASFQLGFIGRDANGIVMRHWGTTNASTLSLPATGSMRSSESNVYNRVTVTAPPGNYRINFDSASGAFSVQQRYPASSSINFIKNPSFEILDEGAPQNWEVFHGNSGEQADFGAHSGARCGVLMRKTIPADPDLGNFVQTTATLPSNASGKTFRVSAAFRTKGDWQASNVRIIIEWQSGASTFAEDAISVTDLSNQWKTYVLESIVPRNDLAAKILLKYDGDPGTGFLLVDDVEARFAASREQNFDIWGNLPSFQKISPDWEVTSGKTMFNFPASAPVGEVIISKYIEGTGNNKAIEIFNGTANALDLGAQGYFLQQYDNGATTASVSMPLSGVLQPGTCLVVARPPTPPEYAPDSAISSLNPLTNKHLTFNGDDVIVLRKGGPNGMLVDRVGQVGANATGSLWSQFTTDHTLTRRHDVLTGTVSGIQTTFPLDQWEVGPRDSFAELGIHFFSFDDPNAPYIPTGYSILLNTNAALITPELDDGIGDVYFYARAQGDNSGPDIQLILETTTSATDPNWTFLEEISVPVTATNFQLMSSFASRPEHTVLRIRHVADGTTNRIRIDDVRIGLPYLIRRSQNFAAWTNVLNAPLGSYTRAEWNIRNATITSAGFADGLGAAIYPDEGAVTTPTYESGVGPIKFWLANLPDELGEVRAEILISTNNGASWTTNTTVGFPAKTSVFSTNVSISIILPVPASVRISAKGSPSPMVIDNIDIAVPSFSRQLTFDDLVPSTQYKTFDKDGWSVTDVSVVNKSVAAGYAGRLRNGIIISPYMEEIGVISFTYMLSEFGGDATALLTVEASPDGNSWTVLTAGLTPPDSPQLYSYYNTNTAYHYVRIRQTTNDKRILIDDISIGVTAPVPSCSITASLAPVTPAPNEGFYLTADVSPQNNPEIIAVTGRYRIASAPWQTIPLTAVGYGSYRSADLLPPLAPGTKITFSASVVYAGPGAAPGSSGYTTNTAFSTTNVITIMSVKRGTVWINEIFYAPYEGEEGGGFWGDSPYNHEFVELCGVAGTSIANWKLQLLFCTAGDISKNSGQAIYATYPIPSGTVLANTANGFGFYVIGDQELKDDREPVDQVLTVFVPAAVNPFAADDHDHIHDPSGIVRLLDDNNNVVYSLSYGAYDSNSDRIPVKQDAYDNTNSLALIGTGYEYVNFSWSKTNALTIGAPNIGQVLVPEEGLPLMPAWHSPDGLAQTRLQGTFTQFFPLNAVQSDPLLIHYAYTNADYPNYGSLGGNVYYRKQGDGGWNTTAKNPDFPGNEDSQTGYAYARMVAIPAYSYHRLDTLEYVIEAIPPDGAGLDTAYLGSDGSGSSTAYETLAEAQQYPFRYTFPIADQIEITKFSLTNNQVYFETDGNDPQDPIVTFKVRSTTNLMTPTAAWGTIEPQSVARTNEQNYIIITNPAGMNRFFAIEPLWP